MYFNIISGKVGKNVIFDKFQKNHKVRNKNMAVAQAKWPKIL